MLPIILSALALCASIIRFVAQMQLFETAGVPFQPRSIAFMELGNWAAWTTWGLVLAWVMSRMDARQRSATTRTLTIMALAIAPIVLVPILVGPVHLLAMRGPSLGGSTRHVAGHNLPTNALLSVAMLGVALLQTAQRRTRRLELTAADLRTQLAESQLATLRTQMDPHFLFNALNGIAVLARRGETAPIERMVMGLSSLLRNSLDSAHDQVIPLRVELDVLQHYLDIEAARFGGRLNVTMQIDDAARECMVPSFLLQPIVENAIRHGFEDGTRQLHLAIAATRRRDVLELTVDDDGVGLSNRETVAEGIGLGNTRARLTGLFGSDATLALQVGQSGRGVCVVITIPVSSNARARA